MGRNTCNDNKGVFFWADMSSQAAWPDGLSTVCALFGAFSEKELKQSRVISYRRTFEHVDLAASHLCQSTESRDAFGRQLAHLGKETGAAETKPEKYRNVK